MDSSSISQDELLQRLADGDSSAVEPLWKAVHPRVLEYSRRKLHGHVDADDVAQRAMLKLIERAADYDGRPAMAWALAFAYWECRAQRTREMRARAAPLHDHGDLEARCTPVDQRMSDQEEASALGKAMEDLAEEDRALLLPDDVDAFERLVGDLKPATRRKRKERLMRRLRKSVQEIFQSRGQGDD